MRTAPRNGRPLTRAERLAGYGAKIRAGGPARFVFAMQGGDPGVRFRFAGRHRKARVAAFQGAQRAKAAVEKARRAMRKQSQRRNRA